MAILQSVGLLVLSNIFMTAAWYGHLRFKEAFLWQAILASWLLALPEYMLQVPANRFGYHHLSAYQLKIIQECVTLIVFAVFAFFVLGEKMTTRYFVSFLLIVAAVVVAFGGQRPSGV